MPAAQKQYWAAASSDAQQQRVGSKFATGSFHQLSFLHNFHWPSLSLRDKGFLVRRMIDEEMERQELARQNRVSKPVSFLRSSIRVVSLSYSSSSVAFCFWYIYERIHTRIYTSCALTRRFWSLFYHYPMYDMYRVPSRHLSTINEASKQSQTETSERP